MNRGSPAKAAMLEGHERTILAYLMSPARDACHRFLHRIDERIFAVPSHRTIVHAIHDVFEEGDKVNLLTVSERLNEMQRLQECGGRARITEIALETTGAEIAESALSCVLDDYREREAVKIGKQLQACEIDIEKAEASLGSLRSLHGVNGALPEIEDAAVAFNQAIILPPDVIEGVLHLGGKLVFGGGSKSFKTWLLIDLAISVATGSPWLNGYTTTKGRVLYVNLELPKAFCEKRVQTICDERQIRLKPGMLDLWHLRGHAMKWQELKRQIPPGIYALIIIDPIYKILLGRDEIKASDIALAMNELEELAVSTSAAVAFGAHYSKGNQALKESIDRISGSGVYARDPDSILTFTTHEEKDCFTVEMTLRNHPPQKPFVVRWEYPLFILEKKLSPTKLRQVGRPPSHSAMDVLLLMDEPMFAKEIVKAAWDEHNIPRRSVFDYLSSLKRDGFIRQPERRGKYERIEKPKK